MEYKIKVKKKNSDGNLWNVYVYWSDTYTKEKVTECLNRMYNSKQYIWEYL